VHRRYLSPNEKHCHAKPAQLGWVTVLVGKNGPSVVIDGRTCAWLERYAHLSALRVQVRGTVPDISTQLEEIRVAAMAWRSSATGTEEAPTAELAARSQWLSTKEAAEQLHMTDRAVRKAIREGRLTATAVGRAYRVAIEDVATYNDRKEA
jgi:excisionase family DNA binding protein